MRKIFFVVVFCQLLLPLLSLAACPTSGLVPCGTEDCPCTLCHFFVLFQRILNFVTVLAIIISTLAFTIGGFLLLTGGGNPGNVSKANKIFQDTAIGLVIMFSAWVITNTLFLFIGVATWTGLQGGWFVIECPV
ncbi:MAG: hypothetical protein COT34_01230 [Candidatus Nealsonbacteria bacterium CG08_land_8_20_14_0_20_43_11]|uniref:Ammonium transporter AmtB-like domain-containing protein n=1 Tax=Candidatus Nealsonbacteria bacterium CG08_land_8_20_14_0_20_43_11 TaxID=1974706 RepID=A0A2M6T1D0_9BACT|nr:MAG: hypothetical protein COT34_01230 [Candidatus Nealsonbacteria bacterium CG08_land_8_20_14_0_20_43_11]